MSYKDLISYRQATIIYDLTKEFCDFYVEADNKTKSRYKSRMYDQMVQAARSGKSNIVEASQFARTSSKMEIKLIGSARASLEELLEDYVDWLRQRGKPVWDKNSENARKIRGIKNRAYEVYKVYMNNGEIMANVMICLINQTNYLLD